MITDAEVATMIPAKDLERTRRLYEDVLGFTPDRDEPGAISYAPAAVGSTSMKRNLPAPPSTP